MTVKIVGTSGQISLGKEFAGRTVIVENPEDGVWIIRTAQVIPDNEQWLHEEPAKSKLEAGLKWAAQTPVAATDLDAFEAKVLGKREERAQE